MANQNRTLGKFNLEGIPAAPRGVPQIEVKFDIDANGIVNVSAIDKATGKEQKITITASSSLSDSEIDEMVRDAEENAAADAERKRAVELKNQGDSLVYNTEKMLNELGDKVDGSEKAEIEAAVASLKTALESEDADAIEAEIEALTQKSHSLAEKLYREEHT